MDSTDSLFRESVEKRFIELEKRLEEKDKEIKELKALVQTLLSQKTTSNTSRSVTSTVTTPSKVPVTSTIKGSPTRNVTPGQPARTTTVSPTASPNKGVATRTTTRTTARTPVPKVAPKTSSINPKDGVKYYVSSRPIYVFPPTNYQTPELEPSEPNSSLQLEYIYGYNGRDGRDNVFFISSEEIVYTIAGTGVIYNLNTHSQRFFVNHNEDILCLSTHPSNEYAVTGQLDPKGPETPYICVWKTDQSMEEVCKLYHHEKGVIVVSFSPDGEYLFSIGNEETKTIAIWDWKNKKLLKQSQIGKEKILLLKFNPFKPNTFITAGVKHLRLWTYDSSDFSISSQPISFSSDSVNVPPPLGSLCVHFLDENRFIIGTSDGDLCFFNRGSIEKVVKVAKGTGTSLLVSGFIEDSANNRYIIGHGEGQLSFYDKETLQELYSLSLDSLSPSKSSLVVKAITLDPNTQTLVIGTKGNELFSLNVSTREVSFLLGGHRDELWALAVHPKDHLFVTGSNDKSIRFWNFETKTLLLEKVLLLSDQVKSIDFHPLSSSIIDSSSDENSNENNHQIAIGTMNKETRKSDVIILNYKNASEVKRLTRNVESIDVVKYSPSGKFLAVSCGNILEIYLSSDLSKQILRLQGHSSRISHLDWSLDNKFIVTNSIDYEILFWSLQAATRVSPQTLRDCQWATWTCILGWPVQGIWPEGSDGTDVNALNLDKESKVVITGDDFGTVKVFDWPCIKNRAPHKTYTGHSSHVTNVRFTFDNSKVITLGGNDTAIFQWKYIKAN